MCGPEENVRERQGSIPSSTECSRGGASMCLWFRRRQQARVVELVVVIQGQVTLQAELFDTLALIERRPEIMKHQLQSAAQQAEAAGPPGIRPRLAETVTQTGNWSAFWGARDTADSEVHGAEDQSRARSVAHQQAVMCRD
jgi:hypothetical protein